MRWVQWDPRGSRAGMGRVTPVTPLSLPCTVWQRGSHGGDAGADAGAECGHDVEQAPHGRRYPATPRQLDGDNGGGTPKCHQGGAGQQHPPAPLLSSRGLPVSGLVAGLHHGGHRVGAPVGALAKVLPCSGDPAWCCPPVALGGDGAPGPTGTTSRGSSPAAASMSTTSSCRTAAGAASSTSP